MDTTAVGEAGTPPRSGHIAYFPALDGLRAIAVAAVLLYHAGQAWIPGGFLGVEMFFVISGYLISSLLLVEWESSQRIDLKAFWLRRARRLMPKNSSTCFGQWPLRYCCAAYNGVSSWD